MSERDLPEGWVETSIGEISNYIQRGKSPEYTESSSLPVINQKCIRWNCIDSCYLKYIHPSQFKDFEKDRFIQVGDILWNSTGTGTVGRAYLVQDNDCLIAKVVDSHVTIIRVSIETRYLFYFIKSPFVQQKINTLCDGTTNQIELSKDTIKSLVIPLPPLAEQIRIADKLDSLLADLETCRAHLDRVPETLKRFRQSVLAAATSGRLTEDWRKKNGVHEECDEDGFPISWSISTPDEIKDEVPHSLAIGPFGSDLKVSDYTNHGVPLVFVKEIRAKHFGGITTKYVSLEKAKKLKAHIVHGGDLLITKMGDPPGDCAIYPFHSPDAVITADCVKLSVNKSVAITGFISYVIESPKFRDDLREITVGVAQQKISLERFRSIPLVLAPLPEQAEIVKRVEALFAVADSIEERYKAARAKVDSLEPALLAKAFRGELVAQDPADESASVLLERIKASRAASETKPVRKTRAKAEELIAAEAGSGYAAAPKKPGRKRRALEG